MCFKNFWLDNSYNIGKVFIHQVGMTIFGLSVTMAVNVASKDNETVTLCVSIFSILFHMFLLYTLMRDLGAKDKIRVDAGRMQRDTFLGAKVAFFANIPNIVLAVLMLLGLIFGYLAASAEWARQLYGSSYLITLLAEATYTGLARSVLSAFGTLSASMEYTVVTVFYILTPLPSILTCFVAYRVGLFDDRVAPSGSKSK